MAGSHHVEWLGLLDVSGPFLSPPVLDRVFPQGLDGVESDHVAKLVLAYEEWADEQVKPAPDPAIHDAWIRFVLFESLELTPEVLLEGDGVPTSLVFEAPEHAVSVRPDFVVADPGDGGAGPVPRLLVSVWPAGVDLVAPVGDSGWSASPIERMVALCRAEGVGCRLGLVTNGERWALVDAPVGETSGHASWYANLWGPERLTLRAFRSLLGMRRFFGVSVEDRLEAILAESTSYQADVTDQLGLQVRRAVEVLVQAIDRADTDTGRALLADVESPVVYEAALTMMMRLVFLFSAEERGLLLLGVNDMFDQFYAVSTLSAQLREAADEVGEEVLERRQDAWSRLLGTFRAIFAGVHHEDLEIIPYGSSLFDPDRFAFLEGREAGSSWRDTAALPLPIDNRTVLLLLESLQLLDMGKGRGARRLSFRALDIEQIGHVYETLLDHTALRATEPMVSLGGNQGYEPEIPVAELNSMWSKDEGERDPLVEFLHKKTKKSESVIKKALAKVPDQEMVARLQMACGGDRTLLARVLPFHDLIRLDPWGDPVIIHQGAVFVTAGEDRRSTGTHYTPRALTEEIVQYALEPIVYSGPAEGVDREDWELKTPAELLGLKVCDPAMGSGAFLVQVCRYLSERLVEAWDRVESDIGDPIGIEGGPTTSGDALPVDVGERLALAKRLLADRCIYGVDINPIAVEMAKLSIWLVTLAKDAPFTFLDHALKCGDSLLGLHDLDQVRYLHPDVNDGRRLHHNLWDPTTTIDGAVAKAQRLREELEAFTVADIYDAHQKHLLSREAESTVDTVRLLGDMVVSASVESDSSPAVSLNSLLASMASEARKAIQAQDHGKINELRIDARARLNRGTPDGKPRRRPFHWPVEFPEVFSRPEQGFDAVLMNPPFVRGKSISGLLGHDYRTWLMERVGGGAKGNVDLSALFVLRACWGIAERGFVSSLATNTLAQGDTKKASLERLVGDGRSLIRAVRSRSWPGGAAVAISMVWLAPSPNRFRPILDGETVERIDANLSSALSVEWRPQNVGPSNLCYIGSYVRGRSFVLRPNEAEELIASDSRNAEVVRPYLNGKDLNSRPGRDASRWVIDFGERNQAEAQRFPDVWRIAIERVKSERLSLNDIPRNARHRKRWWTHAETRPGLYSAIGDKEWVVAMARTSKHVMPVRVPTGPVFSDSLVVFPVQDNWFLGVLSGSAHWWWALTNATLLEDRPIYKPTDCFQTFPLPSRTNRVEDLGGKLHQHRVQISETRSLGLTGVYNRFHSASCTEGDVVELRAIHDQLDAAVAEAFGWSDLDVRAQFVDTRWGERYTLSRHVRDEVLSRLLQRNQAFGEPSEETFRSGNQTPGESPPKYPFDSLFGAG